MGARTHVAKWGSSLAVRIPKPIAEQWGVREGSAIEIVSRGDEVVLKKSPYRRAEMIDRVTRDNLHSGVDTGPPAGNEEW